GLARQPGCRGHAKPAVGAPDACPRLDCPGRTGSRKSPFAEACRATGLAAQPGKRTRKAFDKPAGRSLKSSSSPPRRGRQVGDAAPPAEGWPAGLVDGEPPSYPHPRGGTAMQTHTLEAGQELTLGEARVAVLEIDGDCVVLRITGRASFGREPPRLRPEAA